MKYISKFDILHILESILWHISFTNNQEKRNSIQ